MDRRHETSEKIPEQNATRDQTPTWESDRRELINEIGYATFPSFLTGRLASES